MLFVSFFISETDWKLFLEVETLDFQRLETDFTQIGDVRFLSDIDANHWAAFNVNFSSAAPCVLCAGECGKMRQEMQIHSGNCCRTTHSHTCNKTYT